MAYTTPNDTSSVVASYWSKKLQEEYMKRLTGQHVSRMNLQAVLKDGDTFKKSYLDLSNDELDVYTPGTDMPVESFTTTNENLSVNLAYGDARKFDDFETVQEGFDVAAAVAPKDAERLANRMDIAILSEIANANQTIDNGVLSGSASDSVGISATTSNVVSIFSMATRKFEEVDVTDPNKKAVISPKFADVIQQYTAGRDTQLGDTRLLDGSMGQFMGYDLYVSNQLMGVAVLAMATQPTANDTVTIDSVTFTFVSPIGTTAGNVLIGADVDTTRASLRALIVAPGTTAADRVGFATTTTSYKKLTNRIVSATNDNSANTLTIKYAGRSALVVSETLTDATDTWTSNKTTCDQFFSAGTPVDVVTQIAPMVEITRVPLQFGNYVKRGMLYGKKTFRDGTFRQVNVRVLA